MREPEKSTETSINGRDVSTTYGSISVSEAPTNTKNEPLSRKVKLLTCAAVFYGNIGLALVCHVHGPALTSFQKKYNTDDETISVVFSLMTAGISSGALLSGFIFRVVNRQLATVIVFGIMGICMFAIPFCPNLTIFYVVSSLMGFFGGFYSSAQFTWILEMMQSECPPYVIAEHFFYAFGIITSSLLLAPFLSKDDGGGGGRGRGRENGTQLTDEEFYGNGNTSDINIAHHIVRFNSSLNNIQKDAWDQDEENKLIIPFTVMAVILELAMVFQLILFIFYRYHAPPPQREEKSVLYNPERRRSSVVLQTGLNNLKDLSIERQETQPEPESAEEPGWKRKVKRLLLIIYLGVFCGSFKGMEDNVVAFLPKYAQNGPLHMSESDSAYVLSASMMSYTTARFCGIFIVYKVPPRALLCVNMVITIICNILLMTKAQDSHAVLWATAVLFGIGFSTAYGCFSSYMERYLQVTDAVGAFVLVYGAGIAAAYPVLIGAYIEKYPVILGFTTWISIGICSIVLLLSGIQTHYDKKRY